MLDAKNELLAILSRELAKSIDSEILTNLINIKYDNRISKMEKILEIANKKSS